MAGAYSPGERAVQARADVIESADRSARAIHTALPEVATAFLVERPFVVAGARDADGLVWASLLSGPSGFVHALDERTVELDAGAASGDPLADLAEGAHLGLLALDPATRRRMRVNGTVRHRRGGGLLLDVDQVVANCPKYITERRPRARAGADGPGRSAGGRLDGRQRAWVAAADTFFIATATDEGADASHRGGMPGFVEVDDDRRLSWPDYAGNAMFLTLGNLESDPRAELLFIDWEGGRTLQLTGTSSVDWDPTASARFPGAERIVVVELERWVELEGVTRWSWELGSFSRSNPPVHAGASPRGG